MRDWVPARWAVRVGLLMAALLYGCSAVPKSTSMIPAAAPVTYQHSGTVDVHVQGGGEDYRVSNEALRAAIVAAIEKSKVFSGASPTKANHYRLDVVMGSVRQPPFGGNMTVEMQMIWNLSSTNAVTVWQETFDCKHTATGGDALIGMNRLRMATEGAARDCVAKGIRSLGALKLSE